MRAYAHLGIEMNVVDVCMGRPSFDLERLVVSAYRPWLIASRWTRPE